MKTRRLATILALSILFTPSPESSARTKSPSLLDIAAKKVEETLVGAPEDDEVCFSPDEPCEVKLWKFLQSAKKTLDIAIYDLTLEKVAHEILMASKRVRVRVLVDRRQSKGEHSLVDLLIKAGIDVRFGVQRGIMHNKFTIVDNKRIETGSFNYTLGASSKNNENQIYLSTPSIVNRYRARFETIWAAAQPAGNVAVHQ